jgi:hypothetical protein
MLCAASGWGIGSADQLQEANMTDGWTYRNQTRLGYDHASGRDLTRYNVEAPDGSIGKRASRSDDHQRGRKASRRPAGTRHQPCETVVHKLPRPEK